MPPRGAERRAEARRRLLLVAVTDRRRCRGDLLRACEAAVRGGATAVLLRDRDLPRAGRRRLAKALRRITAKYGASLLVHTDTAIVRQVDADGVHLAATADAAAIAAARRSVGRARLVGVSAHTKEQVQRAAAAGADYAFFGPVWATGSHPGVPASGPQAWVEAHRAAPVGFPLVAVGGVRPSRVRSELGMDFLHCVAAIESLIADPHPGRAAGRMVRALLGPFGAEATPPGDERRIVASFLRSMGRNPHLLLGPGDDAVVLRAGRVALAKDVTVEGVHYEPGTRARAVGAKAAGRALSDLAAVGARPLGILVGLGVRREGPAERARGIEAGAAAAARACGARILGGDTKETPGTEFVAVTAVGRVPGPPALSRSGGRPGDALFVTGPLGGSLRGRHLRPRPRIEAGLDLRRRRLATACVDVSDGLGSDLHRLCRASGTGALLEAWRIPIHGDARKDPKGDPLSRALFDGEDYELLFAVPAAKAALVEERGVAGRRATRVGRLLHPEAGVVVQRENGALLPLPDAGWAHFRRRKP